MRHYNYDRQHERHKLHAYERLMLLLDGDTFTEVDSDSDAPDYVGVITGRGTVCGKPVFVFAQDFAVSGGSISLNHGQRVAHLIDSATKAKCPVIGIYNSSGARIGEGINALAGCGELISRNVHASGVIPQIAVIAGPCAGAAAYSAAISDFVFSIKSVSQMYVTGSKVIEAVTGHKYDLQELGGAEMHSSVSGVAHFISDSEKECFDEVRRLISVLPSNNEDRRQLCSEGFTPNTFNIDSTVPKNGRITYSMPEFVRKVFDTESFIEVHRHFARNIVVGFAKLSGITVGVVANNPRVKAGCLDIDSSDKAARFVRFCDAFSIPIVTFVDTPGYLPGIEEEHGGIIRHGAKVLYAYSEASTIKITVIIRKAYGGAYIALGSKQVGADFVYASPYAEMAVMGAESAVSILHHKELASSDENSTLLRDKFIKEYREKYLNPQSAVTDGCVDGILDFKDIRKRLYDDILILKDKQEFAVTKKHGNIPL